MTLAEQFLATARRLADDPSRDRKVPSPSSTMKCTRQNWFKAHGFPKTHQPDNGESAISAETGRASEPFLTDILLAMDPPLIVGVIFEPADEDARELGEEELARVSAAGGQVDNIGVMADGEHVLIEFKRKGVFDMMDLVRKGVQEAQPDEFMQLQILMAAKGLKRALYIAANWDRGMWTAHTTGKYAPKVRHWDERPDGAHVEWVDFSPAAAKAAKQRAEMQQGFIDNEADPARVPRDYDPFGKDARFPCGWCVFFPTCKEAR